MVIKLYISGISGNKEVKKKQQRVQMILDSKQITYEAIDITEPGKEKDKEFMQQNGKVREDLGKYPLPPQIFNDDDFCGDYEDFDLANEVDELEKFLHITSPKILDDSKVNGQQEKVIESVVEEKDKLIENFEEIESNEVIDNNKDHFACEKENDVHAPENFVEDKLLVQKDNEKMENHETIDEDVKVEEEKKEEEDGNNDEDAAESGNDEVKENFENSVENHENGELKETEEIIEQVDESKKTFDKKDDENEIESENDKYEEDDGGDEVENES